MKFVTGLCAVALAVSVAGCSGLNINTDYNPGAVAAMQEYQTYSWLPESRGGRGTDARINNPITIQRIKNGVDRVLQAKGFQKVNSGGDFKVGWHGAINDQTDYTTYNDYYGYGWGGWGYGGWGTTTATTTAYTIQQGTLIVDVVDSRSNELVWRGSAQAEVGQAGSPEDRQARINEACNKLLASFPPGG
jgi:hypothetical protein